MLLPAEEECGLVVVAPTAPADAAFVVSDTGMGALWRVLAIVYADTS